MVAHASGARRKDRQIGATLALHFQLTIGDRFTDLVVGYRRPRRRCFASRVRLDLLGAPSLVLTRGGRIVAVAIDDHKTSPHPPALSTFQLAARGSAVGIEIAPPRSELTIGDGALRPKASMRGISASSTDAIRGLRASAASMNGASSPRLHWRASRVWRRLTKPI